MQTKPIEELLNNLYVKAWSLVEDLTLATIPEDDRIRSEIDEFVGAARRSFDTLRSAGYVAAWTDLEAMSMRFRPLCQYKDRVLPQLDANLSRECAEAYRALPEPQVLSTSLNPSLLHEINVKRIEQAYHGQSRCIEPVTVLART